MSMDIREIREGKQVHYYIRLHHGTVARTVSLEAEADVDSEGRVIAVKFGSSVEESAGQRAILTEILRNPDVRALMRKRDRRVVLKLSDERATGNAHCDVNVDLDATGRVVGIEVL